MRLKPLISHHPHFIWQTLARWLLPASCLLCGQAKAQPNNLCQPCQQELPILPEHCPQCARFLPPLSTGKCGACLSHTPAFDLTHALYPYEPPIIQLITQFKFQHQLTHAKLFGELLTKQITQQWYQMKPLPDLIIPVPLHPKRLYERGFNQAHEIARYISKKTKIPLDIRSVERKIHTAPQSSLSARKRETNMANAFAVTRDYTGLTIAVLDDVITTGHTVAELGRMLKLHGANRIEAWCCARRG